MKKQKWTEKDESRNFLTRFSAIGCVIGMMISVFCGIMTWNSISWGFFLAFLAGFVWLMDS